ncbi:MAG: GGDEF domain-containing protein [Sideroxyarcus sp.]|nr:GGDEF domain-containing protein [Sideroxyarcus sp.]
MYSFEWGLADMYFSLLLIFAEVTLITFLNYAMADTYVSFDVLYCLPIIQAARSKALQAQRKSDSSLPVIIGFTVAFVWSLSERLISPLDFPPAAFVLNTFTRGVTFSVIGRVVSCLWREHEYGRKDFLTDITNRAEWLEKFEYEQLRSERSGKPYSLLYIDIDRFKQLNDSSGHLVGDTALKKVADILKNDSRKMDTVARIGGDEFAVLFPETDTQACEFLLNRIKLSSEQEFEKCRWDISLSIGHITETGKARGVQDILDEVDAMMYAVKKAKLQP